MSYQVLARKWRPRSFKAMVGQEHVLRMLTNALDNQRLHHAYLFTGTRGVGKTTLARLLAKCLNCEQGITSTPCDQCSACNSIDAGRFLDLIEVDAASRTKVEDTREILDNVQYAPSQGRYKIYLIDEVHMLSGHSFNALLKTLEEPPAHVKFLLATTDPKRLPITILSRCLQFNLKRVPVEQIAGQLQHICETENIAFELPALNLLAKAADGSMRDSLSLLDQAITYCGEKITTQETHQMLGSIEQDAIYRLLDALVEENGQQLLIEIKQLAEHAPDFNQVLEELLSTLHQISVAQVIKDSSSNDNIAKFAARFTPEAIQLYYQIALTGRRDLPLASNPAQGFEMVMLRMLAFTPVDLDHTPSTKGNGQNNVLKTHVPSNASKSTIATKTENTSNVAKSTIATKTEATSNPPKQAETHSQKNTAAQSQTGTSSVTSSVKTSTDWTEILAKLELTGLSQTLAANCILSHLDDRRIELTLAKTHEAIYNQKIAERIQQALERYFAKPIKLDIKMTSAAIHTPAKQHQEEQITRHNNATDAIRNDSTVQKMMDMFGATIDMESVKAI